MNQAITRPGYDPFASPFDAPERNIIGGLADDEVGSLWGSIKSAAKGVASVATAPVRATVKLSTGDFKGAWHTTKNSLRTGAKVVTGTVGKYAIAGASIAFPPAAPALAGVYAGAKVLQELDSPDPKKRAAAAVSVAATKKLAAAGDAGAQRGWAAISTAQSMMRKGATPMSIVRSAPRVTTSRAPTRFSTSYKGIAAKPIFRGTLVDTKGQIHGPATWEMR